MTRLPLLGLVMAAMLAACQIVPEGLMPLVTPSKLQAAEPRVNAAIPGNRSLPSSFESRSTPRTPSLAAQPGAATQVTAQGGGDITVNFVDTDIREIVRVVLGETLKVNYTIDPGVQGTATLEIKRPVPRATLLSLLDSLLNENGATLVEQNGIYRVTAAGGAAALAPVTAGEPGSGTEMLALRYASAKDLLKIIEPYVGEGGRVTADPNQNALLVSGPTPARRTIVAMIRAFDIDALAGQSYALFPVRDGTPSSLAAELEKALRADGEGALAGVVRILPMDRVNAVLVISSQPRYLDEAKRLVGLTKRALAATVRTWHVYYVQNGQSADLENVLQRAFTPGHVTAPPVPPGSTAPGSEVLRLGSGDNVPTRRGPTGGAATAISGLGSAAAVTPAATPPQPTAPAAAEPALAEAEKGGEEENRIRIIANRRNNALLIYATPGEYAVVEGMLRKIDIIPLQVLIEATIAEVTLNDKLNYGTQFFIGHTVKGTLSFATPGVSNTLPDRSVLAPIGFLNNFPGFVLTNGVREALSALAEVTQVKVLSAPQVMVMDNEPARLQVGALVPVITQTAQSTLVSNAPIVNSVEYRDTGVIMVVTPRVNSGGLVTLEIAQEVSDVANTTSSNIDSPTFNQRLIRTRVAVQDGQTVGMAGLIRDSDSQGNSGIPILKDIPLLGTLASSQQNTRERTELLVLITPRVVHDQRDALALTEDLRRTLVHAGLVPQQLEHKPPRGSPNPNGY